MIRYFRATAGVYQSICEQLDAAYGYPKPENLTSRTLPAIETLPVDEQGRVHLAVSASYCDYNLPSEMLEQLIAAGQVEEITAAEYVALLPEDGDA